MHTKFQKIVWEMCKKIPHGRISTYQEIGKAINSRAYRAIGQALRNNPYAPIVPCHRVISSDGTLGGYNGKMNSKKKINLLNKEGIEVKNNNIIDFKKKLFRF
jgi:methylated-DNA-[protein]-cysteine S-methyltransferase